MEKLLELKELSKSFSGNCVLNKISLTLKPGEVHALVGENGAGKSTLIKCISGIYIPDSGELYVKGQQQRFTNPLQALQAGIAVIHQELTPIRERSVMENIWLGREPRKGLVIDKKRMYADTEKLLDKLEISVRPSDIMKNLSIAQKMCIRDRVQILQWFLLLFHMYFSPFIIGKSLKLYNTFPLIACDVNFYFSDIHFPVSVCGMTLKKFLRHRYVILFPWGNVCEYLG